MKLLVFTILIFINLKIILGNEQNPFFAQYEKVDSVDESCPLEINIAPKKGSVCIVIEEKINKEVKRRDLCPINSHLGFRFEQFVENGISGQRVVASIFSFEDDRLNFKQGVAADLLDGTHFAKDETGNLSLKDEKLEYELIIESSSMNTNQKINCLYKKRWP